MVSKRILYDKCNNPDDYPNQSDTERDFWCSMYDGLYYEMNFNSFTHALVVLMALVIVNNWHVITQMYIYSTNTKATKIYFIIVYFTTVVIVMNVLQAFILDVFLTDYDNYKLSHSTTTQHQTLRTPHPLTHSTTDVPDDPDNPKDPNTNDDHHDRRTSDNKLKKIHIYHSFRAMTQHFTLKLMNEKSNDVSVATNDQVHPANARVNSNSTTYNDRGIKYNKDSGNGSKIIESGMHRKSVDIVGANWTRKSKNNENDYRGTSTLSVGSSTKSQSKSAAMVKAESEVFLTS